MFASYAHIVGYIQKFHQYFADLWTIGLELKSRTVSESYTVIILLARLFFVLTTTNLDFNPSNFVGRGQFLLFLWFFQKYIFKREGEAPIFCDFDSSSSSYYYYYTWHLSWKFNWNMSSRSEDMKIFCPILIAFIIFLDFLRFPCYKGTNDVSIKQMILVFFTLNLL